MRCTSRAEVYVATKARAIPASEMAKDSRSTCAPTVAPPTSTATWGWAPETSVMVRRATTTVMTSAVSSGAMRGRPATSASTARQRGCGDSGASTAKGSSGRASSWLSGRSVSSLARTSAAGRSSPVCSRAASVSVMTASTCAVTSVRW